MVDYDKKFAFTAKYTCKNTMQGNNINTNYTLRSIINIKKKFVFRFHIGNFFRMLPKYIKFLKET